ncbi:MAG: TonB-dependent receptor [Colwellia sp.]|nr:TonB-dependent receptor [Colwellia sp.]
MQFSKIVSACSWSVLLSSVLFSQQTLAQKISGKVIKENGELLSKVKITNSVNNQVILTDSQGRFVLDDLAEGIVELHLSEKNYSHLSQRVVVNNQDISNLVIELSPTVFEIIDVYATPLHSSSIESALPVNVLSSDELRLKQASTLGETLKNEVGIHSTYYGPVASSPIIRGLDGPRVLITQNGLDAGDASRVGPDHVAASETSTATQIEVLRGPATLFYGSGAIGGVVNVVDNRIPTSIDNTVEWLVQHNSVATENQASLSLQTGKGSMAFHLDGFWRESSDYKIAGEAALEYEEHHGEGEHRGEEEHHDEGKGVLENSASKSQGFTLGSSYLFDNGYAGISYGYMNRQYGIPGHALHEDDAVSGESEDDHDEGVAADMEQQRIQLLSELNFSAQFINRMQVKLAFTDYQHQEIEHGEIGTVFNNDSLETRIDLYHREINGFNGAWTVHYKKSDFEAIGDEAFTPPSSTQALAFAWLEEKHFSEQVLLQFGVRVEQVSLNADSVKLFTVAQQDFTPLSTSLGLVWDFTQGYNLGASIAYSQRAPSAPELYSYGPHIGTNTFEVGALYDVVDLGHGEFDVIVTQQSPSIETSTNVDLTLRKFTGDFGFVVSVFYNQIDDFYYQQDTGFITVEGEQELPVLAFKQDDVDMYGIEAEVVYQLSEPLKATLFTDVIQANLSNNDALPRIPPMRVGLVLNYQNQAFSGEMSISHYFDQTDIGPLETPTDGYTMLDANFNYYLDDIGLESDVVLFVKGQNLTNVNARVHSSFIKNVAPLPGRGLTLGIRGSF